MHRANRRRSSIWKCSFIYVLLEALFGRGDWPFCVNLVVCPSPLMWYLFQTPLTWFHDYSPYPPKKNQNQKAKSQILTPDVSFP
ncbi:hypothetical protein BX600DRAFT_3405 [Xylariales sp. PMI_506]|nr:hypothetical protein BX600DRAFT_3405 [Xylariales sp. PMI_506]